MEPLAPDVRNPGRGAAGARGSHHQDNNKANNLHQGGAAVQAPLRLSRVPIAPRDDGSFRLDHTRALDDRPGNVVFALDRASNVVDYVAWLDDDPSRWWLRHSAAVLLGVDAIHRAVWRDGRARLYPTPCAWHAAQDDVGACVVDWDAFDPALEFAGLDAVTCSTPALARRLNDAYAVSARQVIRARLRVNVMTSGLRRAA